MSHCRQFAWKELLQNIFAGKDKWLYLFNSKRSQWSQDCTLISLTFLLHLKIVLLQRLAILFVLLSPDFPFHFRDPALILAISFLLSLELCRWDRSDEFIRFRWQLLHKTSPFTPFRHMNEFLILHAEHCGVWLKDIFRKDLSIISRHKYFSLGTQMTGSIQQTTTPTSSKKLPAHPPFWFQTTMHCALRYCCGKSLIMTLVGS